MVSSELPGATHVITERFTLSLGDDTRKLVLEVLCPLAGGSIGPSSPVVLTTAYPTSRRYLVRLSTYGVSFFLETWEFLWLPCSH